MPSALKRKTATQPPPPPATEAGPGLVFLAGRAAMQAELEKLLVQPDVALPRQPGVLDVSALVDAMEWLLASPVAVRAAWRFAQAPFLAAVPPNRLLRTGGTGQVEGAETIPAAMVAGLPDPFPETLSERGVLTLAATATPYPATGGSGAGGAVRRGDWWATAGNAGGGRLAGTQAVPEGAILVALRDTPGQADAAWLAVEARPAATAPPAPMQELFTRADRAGGAFTDWYSDGGNFAFDPDTGGRLGRSGTGSYSAGAISGGRALTLAQVEHASAVVELLDTANSGFSVDVRVSRPTEDYGENNYVGVKWEGGVWKRFHRSDGGTHSETTFSGPAVAANKRIKVGVGFNGFHWRFYVNDQEYGVEYSGILPSAGKVYFNIRIYKPVPDTTDAADKRLRLHSALLVPRQP